MNRVFIFILFTVYCIYCYSHQIENLHAEYTETEDGHYVITLRNESPDTLYLFDSYLQQCVKNDIRYGFYYESIYLHRYSRKTKTCKLSLIPIIGNLCHTPHNVYLGVGIDLVFYPSQIYYSFRPIPPFGTMSFPVKQDAIKRDEYIRDVATDGKYAYLNKFKQRPKHYVKKSQVVYLELAVYKDIKHLSKLPDEAGFDINDWYNQQIDYEIVSIPINVKNSTIRFDCQECSGNKDSLGISSTIEIQNALLTPEVSPEFPGGSKEMYSFIRRNLKFPQETLAAGIVSGRIGLSFIVEKDGSITNIQVILSSFDKHFDEMIMNIFMNMPRWKPGKDKGEIVRTKKIWTMNYDYK